MFLFFVLVAVGFFSTEGWVLMLANFGIWSYILWEATETYRNWRAEKALKEA